MIYILVGFILGAFVPYMARRFAKFMPATPAYALYRLVKPNKISHKRNDKYIKLLWAYKIRSLFYGFVCALVSGLFFYRFGEENIWWWLGFVWTLTLLSEIDYKMFLLPDILTVPLLLCGFAFAASVNPNLTAFESSIAALLGYFVPVIATLLMLWRSTEAFGGGDIKLLTAVGAWLGVEGLLYTILLSCLLFAVYTLVKRQREGAFGPAIAMAAGIVLLFC